MTNKDRKNIGKLYLESTVPPKPDSWNTPDLGEVPERPSHWDTRQTVEDIVRSNIATGIDQVNSPEYNGRSLLSYIQNIYDTLDEKGIAYNPISVHNLIIQYIKKS